MIINVTGFAKSPARDNHFDGDSCLGCQPGWLCVGPAPINQLFNDKSIAVHILFLDIYMWK